MYNTEVKQAFLDEYIQTPLSKKFYYLIFEAFEPYEMEWEADLCTVPEESLREVIKNISGMRHTSGVARISALKNYVRWSLARGMPNARDDMLYIQDAGDGAFETKTVVNPLHLQQYLDIVFSPENDESIDNIYRAFLWLLFSGVQPDDALKIKSENIDFENMEINFDNNKYPIYKGALPSIKNCINLTQFARRRVDRKNPIYKDRFPGDYLMRGLNGVMSKSVIKVGISKKIKEALDSGKTDIRVSPNRVWLSGLFYRMSEREMAGLPLDIEYMSTQIIEGREYTLSDVSENVKRYKKKQFINEYIHDYERWKKTIKML